MSGCAGRAPVQNKVTEYRNGMVVSASPFASKVGLDILKKGGNAVDAAVAIQFALAVVYPNAGNIGGGGFMVYRSASGETNTLDFREKAGAAASRDMYLDQSGVPIVDKSLYGQLAAGVPGSVAGMVAAHQKYGNLPWATLLEPAILLARKGFPLSTQQADELNGLSEKLMQLNPDGTALLKTGKWAANELLKQEELAATLEQIRDHGKAGFYEGKVADQIIAEMKRGGGILTKSDLQQYEAIWRKAITGAYKQYQIITMPPPSSGGIALIQLLKSVEPYPLKRWGFQQDSTIQLMAEAERRVYADRATHLGDPDFYDVPTNALMEAQYVKDRMKTFDWSKATPSSSVKAGEVKGKEHEETTHFSIVDKAGNAVSVTTTLNGSYGAVVLVKGAGFLLNNEMDDFSVKPGAPNMYGLIGGEANAIAPGKRMLSSMTPCILEKDGKLFMVVGTPGGSTIITSVFQTILNVVEFDQNMQQAVSAKRFHHQWLPDLIYAEKGAIDSLTRVKLESKGYIIQPRGPMGRVDAILKTRQGNYQGGADPRGDDQWLGW
ncbi:gamma-glutamyltransferase [Pedobacter sp. PLR]|uniref:gamma-glutamyltransferase n=1 Tax=Pedobacter sp. PLR TaxID=2994465 RepID=UPI00224525D4|nr:gamma-glutamyltransferase [Pedobacter sp. PLR]MCX2453215.1 gamma-glutamyltransferase [Pedobacter sp. PLR]